MLGTADMRPERGDLRPERADLRPVRADLWPNRPDGRKGEDKQTIVAKALDGQRYPYPAPAPGQLPQRGL